MQGKGGFGRGGGREPGGRLLVHGGGKTPAHVLAVKPYGTPGGGVAADAIRDGESRRGQHETGPVFGALAGQGQEDILRAAADVKAQDGARGGEQTRYGVPVFGGSGGMDGHATCFLCSG